MKGVIGLGQGGGFGFRFSVFGSNPLTDDQGLNPLRWPATKTSHRFGPWLPVWL